MQKHTSNIKLKKNFWKENLVKDFIWLWYKHKENMNYNLDEEINTYMSWHMHALAYLVNTAVSRATV